LEKHIDYLFASQGNLPRPFFSIDSSHRNATRLCKIGYEKRLLDTVNQKIRLLISQQLEPMQQEVDGINEGESN